MITRRQPKNVIIRVHKEQTNHGRNFSQSEMDSKRKSIILKVLQDLKKRHKNLFNNLIVHEASIKEDLFILIKEEDLAKFDYAKFLTKADQECIINRLDNKKRHNTYTNISQNELDIEENKKEGNRSFTNTKKDSLALGLNLNDQLQNYANNFNSNSLDINVLHTNNKIDELKNYKEKDEWALMLKKQHLDFLNEKLNRLKQQEEKKKEITQILANQIAEKNYQKQNKLNNEERFNENWVKDYENWKNSEIKMKKKNENKIREFIEERDNVYKSNIYLLKNKIR
jgi:hypothetical protein